MVDRSTHAIYTPYVSLSPIAGWSYADMPYIGTDVLRDVPTIPVPGYADSTSAH
jgi:hypothetical protein